MQVFQVGVIGAMKEEVESIIAQLEDRSERNIAAITFYSGTLNGVSAVVCQSGVGKVNAAMCTQILISQFQVTRMIVTGVAGALHPQLSIGDLIVSIDAVQHDLDASPLGFKKGEIPYAERSTFVADETLNKFAFEVSEFLFPGRVFRGRVLSGDQFIADREHVKRLRQAMGGWCTEMEGAAVAHVCDANRIPFVIIRSISDQADGSAPENFTTFVQTVAKRSAAIVQGVCQKLAVESIHIS